MKTVENPDPAATVEAKRARAKRATENARNHLKPGDRIRVTRCPGTKRWATFAGWNGDSVVSKSGIDYFPGSIDRVNGASVDFYNGAQSEPEKCEDNR